MLTSGDLKPTTCLKAVVFDMDGVIVDSHPAHRFAWKKFLRALGKNVSDTELDFVMDGQKREDILIHFLGPLTDLELREYGQMKNDFFWRAAAEVTPIPGVCEFIEILYAAGVITAVATSASTGRTESILRHLGLWNRFAAVVTGDDVPRGKPDPSIYRLACERIQCPPDGAVAVEDAASGVRAAKSAGLRCIGISGIQPGNPLTAAGADAVLPGFVDLTLQGFYSLLGIQPPHIGESES